MIFSTLGIIDKGIALLSVDAWVTLTGITVIAAAAGVELRRWQRVLLWSLAVGYVIVGLLVLTGAGPAWYLATGLSCGAGILMWSMTTGMSTVAQWYGRGISIVGIAHGVSAPLLMLRGETWTSLDPLVLPVAIGIDGASTLAIGMLTVLTALIILIESADVVLDRRLRWTVVIIALSGLRVHAWQGLPGYVSIIEGVASVGGLATIVYLSMRALASLPAILHRSSGTIVPLGAWTLGALIVLPGIDVLRSLIGYVGPSPVASVSAAISPLVEVIRWHAGSTMVITGLLAAAERWLGWDLKLRSVAMLLGVITLSVLLDGVRAYLPSESALQVVADIMVWSRVCVLAAMLVPAGKATIFSTAP